MERKTSLYYVPTFINKSFLLLPFKINSCVINVGPDYCFSSKFAFVSQLEKLYCRFWPLRHFDFCLQKHVYVHIIPRLIFPNFTLFTQFTISPDSETNTGFVANWQYKNYLFCLTM